MPMQRIYCITDDKPGHRNQLLGLSLALEKLSGAKTEFFSLPLDSQKLPQAAPDIILCAGHKTHWPALKLKWHYKAPLVVLMKPSLPRCLFDFCIAPEHDGLKDSKRVINTVGAINAVQKAENADPKHGLILIGGPSKHFDWDNNRVAAQVRELVENRPDMRWTLSESRRTPEGFFKSLGELNNKDNLSIAPVAGQQAGWLLQHYQECGEIWVSMDSVSMIYESLTAGAKVGLLRLDAPKTSALVNAIDKLVKKNLVKTLDNKSKTQGRGEIIAINEASRVAAALIDRQ